MKKSKWLFILAMIFFCCVASSLHSQSLTDYFKNRGVYTLAGLAHPSNVYQGGKFWIYDDYVIIDIYYENDVRTRVKLDYNGNYFNGVSVLYEGDWFPSFLGIKMIKNFLLELSESMDTEAKGQMQTTYERWLNKKFYEFTGEEMTLLIMTLDWYDYRN